MDTLQEHLNKEQSDLNARQADINDKMAEHASVANEEMGVIKTDIRWIKERLDSFDNKLWVIIGLIVAAALAIIFK